MPLKGLKGLSCLKRGFLQNLFFKNRLEGLTLLDLKLFTYLDCLDDI